MKKMNLIALFTSFLIGLSLSAMQPQEPFKNEDLEKGVKDDAAAALRFIKNKIQRDINNENAYAQALWDGDADRVKFFLDGRWSNPTKFLELDPAKQHVVGKEFPYTDVTPLDLTSLSSSDKHDKWQVYELLFSYGADKDHSWRNRELSWATSFLFDKEYQEWLIAHGAKK